jgi:hypothetical protein
MHQAFTERGQDRGIADYVIDANTASSPIIGRLVATGLHDELIGQVYAVIDGTDGRAHHVRLRGIEAFVDAPPAGASSRSAGSVAPMTPADLATPMRSPMVLPRVVLSPMNAAARSAMSTGFSFVPARRQSREPQGALEPAADGVDVGNGGCGGMLARGIYKHRKPSVPVGGSQASHGARGAARRWPRHWACP